MSLVEAEFAVWNLDCTGEATAACVLIGRLLEERLTCVNMDL